MAIVKLSAPIILQAIGGSVAAAGAILNLATESVFLIGQVYLPAQSGSKVISSAGGAIIWLTAGGVVFATASTTLRVGIQDVAATGLPDGTFDVFKDLVAGTDTLASSSFQNTVMASGSKTLAHGDTIAIGMEMTVRAGADSVSVERVNAFIGLGGQSKTFPYGVALGAKNPESLQCLIKFDDGTYGWIYNAQLIWNTTNTAPVQITYSNASTPDEYIGTFSLPVTVSVGGVGVSIGGVATADNYEIILYSDPYGAPAVIETLAPDPDIIGVTNNVPYFGLLTTPRTLLANTKYGIALRPTTANTIVWGYLNLTSGFDILKNAQPFSTIEMASRTNQTGAFAVTNAFDLPLITVGIVGIDVPGAGGSFVF